MIFFWGGGSGSFWHHCPIFFGLIKTFLAGMLFDVTARMLGIPEWTQQLNWPTPPGMSRSRTLAIQMRFRVFTWTTHPSDRPRAAGRKTTAHCKGPAFQNHLSDGLKGMVRKNYRSWRFSCWEKIADSRNFLKETNISPPKGTFEDEFPLPMVG